MKRILVFLAFVFTVACYASPPPVHVPQFQTDELQFVIQDQFSTVYAVEFAAVEYTAVADIGNCELFEMNYLVAEEVIRIKIPAAVAIDKSYKGKYNLKKPPSDNKMNAANSINRQDSKINKQNSNYGYPFGADYFVLS
jgi:hypothetical protein